MKNITLRSVLRSVVIFSIMNVFFATTLHAQYCASAGGSISDEFIGRVQLNTIDNNTSATTTAGYSDHTAISTNLTRGTMYTITITPTWPGTVYNEAETVWIDYNQDNDFNDPGEQVVTLGASTTSPVSGSFTVPVTALLGNTRMRVAMKYFNTAGTNHNDPCENTFSFGEVEDYTVNILGSGPEIDVSGLGNSIPDGDISPVTTDNTDFGNIAVSSSDAHTFTITNTGSSALTLSGVPMVALSGAGAGQFSVTSVPISPVATSGGTTTFVITYSPVAAVTSVATVTIANNDSDENPYTFTIQGTGIIPVPEINVTGNSVSIADGDVTPVPADNTDFGNVTLAGSRAIIYTIENTGTATLTLSTPVLSGSGNFTLTSAPSLSIAPAGNTTFQVTYTPTTLTTDTATITIANNDGDENPYNFNIQGTGINASSLVQVYCEDFETGGHGWTNTTSTNGSWTTGSEATASTGASGNYNYTQRSSGQYQNDSNQVYTSGVIDLSGYENLNFSIDLWYDMSNDGNTTVATPDGFQIQFTTNGGTNWYPLGQESEGTNWYNSRVVYNFGNMSGGSPSYINGWTNTSSGWVTANIDLESQGFDNNATVQFRVDFRSDSSTRDVGVAFDNVCISGYPVAAVVDPSCGPATLGTNLALWLRADAGTGGVTNGSNLTTWEDQAFTTSFTNAVARSGEEPTYRNNVTDNVNFNPVIKFDGSSDVMYGKKGFHSNEFYVVIKPTGTITSASSPIDIFCGDDYTEVGPTEDVTGFEMGDTSIRYTNDVVAYNQGSNANYGIGNVSTTDTYTNANIFSPRINSTNNGMDLFYNGIDIGNTEANAATYKVISNSRYFIGRSEFFGASYDGDIMEIICYSGKNSDADKNKIQSYLAIKYGITLGNNGTSLDYVDANGNTIWDVSADSGTFNYDIAGIGRDDCSSLNQKQSKSINATGLVTMGIGDIFDTNSLNTNSFANNQEYLMWAHDNGSLAASTPISVDMSAGIGGTSSLVDFISVQRTWKVVESGTIGTTKVSIPEVALSATLSPPGDYLMFISDTPSFSPTSEYRIMSLNGANLETTYNFNNTKYITFGYAPEYIYYRSIAFDGVNDYMDADNNLDLTGAFSTSVWIKKEANDQVILSKRDATYTEGYELKVRADNAIEMSWKNGSTQTIRSTTVIPNSQWHHIALSYDGTTARMYIDGVLDVTETLTPPIANNQSFLIAAADGTNPTDFYQGNIDEVRVWNVSLSENQIRYMMNQEIEEHTDNTVDGAVVPQGISKNEASVLPWANLDGYFPMNRYTFTNVKDESNNNLVAAIKNLDTVDEQTAPLPYVSQANGSWTTPATWTNGTLMQMPGAVSIADAAQTIDWNIVQTAHRVDTQANNTVLSLEVNANELSIENDSKIEVSHYLKINGLMDLVGESQLVQTQNSDLDLTSTGSLERDQKGTADTFTYNDWSAPVSTINTTAINQDFTVSALLYDGTDPNTPLPAQYTTALNGSPGVTGVTAITLSSFWFYKYANHLSGTYSAWQQMGPTGNMSVGEGYTMKGPGTGTVPATQNYTFIGKPNNSTTAQSIQINITAGNDYLIGNPFPSALDANDFITDNPFLDGTLYFWEHWGGGSHYLSQYQGGYALYNLSGGTPAVSHPDVDQTGSGTKTPGRYVAVAQGFFVTATSTGTINFSNTQRNFVKEGASSVFLFADHLENEDKAATTEPQPQPDDTIYDEEDLRTKFRIGFDSPNLLHRQLLLTIDPNTTAGLDNGYDGGLSESQSDEMAWIVEDTKVIIQGAPQIYEDNVFPLSVSIQDPGDITIGVDEFINANDRNLLVLLRDNHDNVYTNLRENAYTISLPAGTYDDRFSIVFKYHQNDDQDDDQDQDEDDDDTLGINDQQIDPSDIHVAYDKNEKVIILSKDAFINIQNATLYSILGQITKQWKPQETGIVKLPVNHISAGAYLLQVQTDKGTIAKKLIIH